MNLIFRMLWLLIVGRWRKPCSVLGPCRTPFRCSIFDLDILRHMNNGKYFSIMDLGRVDLMVRSKIDGKIRAAGFYPVVAAETIRFRKSLGWFERFELETEVIGWDDKAFLLKQNFWRGGTLIAEGVVRARFLKKSGGTVAPTEIIALAELNLDSPQPASWIEDWNRQQL